MQGYLFLAFNIVVTFALYTYLYDPVFEYTEIHPNIQCINFQAQTQSLCAQCVSRTSLPNYSKGVILTHTQPYSILKLRLHQQDYLSCREFIHFIDYAIPSNKPIKFERNPSILAIISELKGSIQEVEAHRNIIDSQFQDLVVFGWYDVIGTKGLKMEKVNEENINSIVHFYFYLLNFVVFTIIVGKIMNPKANTLTEHSWIVITIIILMQILTSPNMHSINTGYLLQVIRLLTFTFTLFRLKIEPFVVYGYLAIGALMVWHPLSLTIYVYISVLLVVLQAFDRPEIKQFWIYVFVTQLLLSINYLVWFLVFRHQADSFCRIIELSQLIFNLLAFTLIEDKKIQTFKEYHDNEIKGKDPQLKPIHLSNEEEEEDDIVIRF